MGLTTASTVWLPAAMGMGIGGGQYVVALVALLTALIVLCVFPRMEEWIYSVREGRAYEVTCGLNQEKLRELEELFGVCGLDVKSHRLIRLGAEMEQLFGDDSVRGFRH